MRVRCGWLGLLSLLLCVPLATVLSCKSNKPSAESEPQFGASSNRVDLLFTYGSEKEKWINDVTDTFNRGDHRTAGGKRIYVKAVPLGSGEAVKGGVKVDQWSK